MLDVQLFDLQSFLPLPYQEALLPRLKGAHEKLQNGSGLGGEFTGWVHLPRAYDRAEFARIQAAARKIQSDSQALVVIGIGGSYLGARGVIDCLCSPNYNLKHKSTPNIYFIGNGLSSDALDVVLELVADVDFSVMSFPNPAPPQSPPWPSAFSGMRWRKNTEKRAPVGVFTPPPTAPAAR